MSVSDWVECEAIRVDEDEESDEEEEVAHTSSSAVHWKLNDARAMQSVQHELMDSIVATIETLAMILEHRTEDSLRGQVRHPDQVRGAFVLDGIPALYAQLQGVGERIRPTAGSDDR